MVAETKKILDPSIKVTATCVRVPVFVGHSEAVNVEFEDFLDEDEARDILREAPGVLVVDKREDGGYVTPVECVGEYATYVSRIRQDPTVENGLIAVGGVRQPAQGRGAQRGADRRAARAAGAEEGLSERRGRTLRRTVGVTRCIIPGYSSLASDSSDSLTVNRAPAGGQGERACQLPRDECAVRRRRRRDSRRPLVAVDPVARAATGVHFEQRYHAQSAERARATAWPPARERCRQARRGCAVDWRSRIAGAAHSPSWCHPRPRRSRPLKARVAAMRRSRFADQPRAYESEPRPVLTAAAAPP